MQITNYLEPHFEPHFNTWKSDKSQANTDNLLKVVDPVITESLRTYGGTSAGSPTLRSKAKLMALNAMDRYDPSRSKLRTHLLTQLQGLRRHSMREEQMVHVPEQLSLERKQLAAATNLMRDQLGRDPSDIELADHTGLSRKRIGRLRTVPSTYAEGTLSTVDEEGGGVYQPGVIAGPNARTKDAWLNFIYHDLTPTDQLIMEHRFGMHGKSSLPVQDIAKKVRLSTGAVSQRARRIQDLLNEFPAMMGQ